jgi:hypothetical protein
VKSRCVVENPHIFFVHDNGPSMDRNWRGSRPRTIRYQIAIGPLSTAIVPTPCMVFVPRIPTRAFLYHAGSVVVGGFIWGLLIAPVLITILIRLIVYVLGKELIHHVSAQGY